MTMRTPVLVGITSAMVGASLLAGSLVSPIANADDPLAPIRAAVYGDRSRTGCPQLAYSQVLEELAQSAVRPGDRRGGDLSGYRGKAKLTMGWGDPQAAAINDTYKAGAGDLIGTCDYTEFGVGFHRDEDSEYDSVSIVFGVPAQAPPPAPAPVPVPASASVQCPAGSPTATVPAGQTCAPVAAPTDKVSVTFVRGRIAWTVNVTNAANIAGRCTFTPNGPGGGLSNRSFDIAANGSSSFEVPPPLRFATYRVVTSCHGTFNGIDVEFGHDEQNVSL